MKPTDTVSLLQSQLHAAREHTQAEQRRNASGTPVHAPATGQHLTAVYEQIRNAAEYTDEHLLLQHAISRFYARNLNFSIRKNPSKNLSEELIIELTQAGYLRNDTYSTETAEIIQKLINNYYRAFWELREAHAGRDESLEWISDILASQSEELLNPHAYLTALAYFAHQHYLQLFPASTFAHHEDSKTNYELSLYIAVHRSLLKSNDALIRHDILRLYNQTPENLEAFIDFNRNLTSLLHSKMTHTMERTITKYGAPLRVLQNIVEERSDIPELLNDPKNFMDTYNYQLSQEYAKLSRRLNKGLLKSIIFIVITKFTIGVAIEIPYDLAFYGSVAAVPLVINLLTPPLYMASLKLGLKMPNQANAKALSNYMHKTLFTNELPVVNPRPAVVRKISAMSKFIYFIALLVPLLVMGFVLSMLNFNILQGVIFFVFISTASFLGFRLSRMIRDLELVVQDSGFINAVVDFFYLPFILIGRWISAKYSRINAVGRILDMAIELPLKSILRLVRQWVRFLREKHEEIY